MEQPPAPSPPPVQVAADIMDAHPPRLAPHTPVGAVARLLLERMLAAAPVVAESGELIGLVTQADIISRHAHVHFPFYLSLLGGGVRLGERRFEEEFRRVTARTAADVMTEDPPTCEEDTPLEDVASMLAGGRCGAVCVVRGDHLAGMITPANLLRLVVVEESA